MYDGNVVGTSRAWAEVTRTKEIVPERRDQLGTIDCDIYLVRHGETQGYSSESGLTPLGSWQAHRRGQELARRVTDGMQVELLCAPTNRARQTAEHLRRGLLDNVGLFGRGEPEVGELHDDHQLPQLRGRHPRRSPRRHQRLPHLPARDGEVRAGRPRRAPRLAGRRRPLLGHPEGRRRPDHPLADDADAALRAAGLVRAPVLARHPHRASASDLGPDRRRRHPLRPDPRLRRHGHGLRPRRAVQHRVRPGAAASPAARPRSCSTATGCRRSSSPTSMPCRPTPTHDSRSDCDDRRAPAPSPSTPSPASTTRWWAASAPRSAR